MIKVYVVNGVEYNVSPDREEQFLKDFPTAQLTCIFSRSSTTSCFDSL